MIMDLVYLLICTTGLIPDAPEHCAVYELRPQHEMTQEIINEKIDRICVMAAEAAGKYGGVVTKCEEIDSNAKQEFDMTASRFLPTARAF